MLIQSDNAPSDGLDPTEDLIRAHYCDFNERRIDIAAARFSSAAVIEHVTGRAEQGPEGYCEFARRWLEAFPDATLSVKGVCQRGDSMYDVDLIATGTHTRNAVLRVLGVPANGFEGASFGPRTPAGRRSSLSIRKPLVRPTGSRTPTRQD